MHRRSHVAALILFIVLTAALPARPAAAQGVADDYVPAPAFGGAPRIIAYTKAPQLLNRDEVQRSLVQNYPAALRERGEGGNVYVWILVDERGEVMSARVRGPSGKPALDASALRVTSSMRFRPGLKDQEPVKVWIALPVIFRSEETAPVPAPERSSQRTWAISPMPSLNMPPEPSGMPSLLNGRYIMRAVRDTFAARLKDAPGGTTTLRLHVNIAGDAATAEIAHSSGNPVLDSLALSFKDRLVFVPAIKSGHYAEGRAEVSFRFPPKEEK